jgi:hypothetical protein
MHSPEGKHSIAVACNSMKIRSEESNGLLSTEFSHGLSSSDYEMTTNPNKKQNHGWILPYTNIY